MRTVLQSQLDHPENDTTIVVSEYIYIYIYMSSNVNSQAGREFYLITYSLVCYISFND